MEILEETDLADVVYAEPSSQSKNGTAFSWGSRYAESNFIERSSDDLGMVYQVRRGIFDKILIDGAAKQDVEVHFGCSATAFDNSDDFARLSAEADTGESYELTVKFVPDASGYGHVLPCLLDLEMPSHLSPRQAHFTHADDSIINPKLDRSKIPITAHPQHRDVWTRPIFLGNNRCSTGVVGMPDVLAGESETVLKKSVYECPMLKEILGKAVRESDFPFRSIQDYFVNIKSPHSRHLALLGSAAEFLDPIFLSGVTIMLYSAKLAADLLVEQLEGGTTDRDIESAKPLMIGVNTFRTYASGWYNFCF